MAKNQLVEEIILKVSVDDSGLDKLGKKSQKAKTKVKGVGDEAEKTGKKFKGAKKQTDTFSKGLKKLAGAAAAGLAISRLIQLGKEAIKVSRDFERLELSLETTFGGEAPAQMAFLREEAKRLGVDLRESAAGFASLAASTKGVLTLKQTQELFSATAEASTALGLSSQKTGMLLKALSQIASKGTLSAEELRQQMGEHLPGAFKLAADSMGVTTKELNKMLEQGEITAKEFLPRFTQELKKAFHGGALRNANSEIAESTRNLNRWNDMLAATGDTLKNTTTPAVSLFLDGLEDLAKFNPLIQLILLNKAIKDIDDATSKAFDGSKFDDSLKNQVSDFTKFINLSKDAVDSFRDSLVGSTRMEDVRIALGLTEKGFLKIQKQVKALSKETESTHALIGAAEDLVKVLKEADKLKDTDFIKTEKVNELRNILKETFEFVKSIGEASTFGFLGENLGDFDAIEQAPQQAPQRGLELGTAAAAEFLVRPTKETNDIAKKSLAVQERQLDELEKGNENQSNQDNFAAGDK